MGGLRRFSGWASELAAGSFAGIGAAAVLGEGAAGQAFEAAAVSLRVAQAGAGSEEGIVPEAAGGSEAAFSFEAG